MKRKQNFLNTENSCKPSQENQATICSLNSSTYILQQRSGTSGYRRENWRLQGPLEKCLKSVQTILKSTGKEKIRNTFIRDLNLSTSLWQRWNLVNGILQIEQDFSSLVPLKDFQFPTNFEFTPNSPNDLIALLNRNGNGPGLRFQTRGPNGPKLIPNY